MSTKPLVRRFEDAEPYEQSEPGLARFSWLLKLDEEGGVPGLCMGRVQLQGPIRKTPAAHADWDQVYLILKGSGTIHLGSEQHEVNSNAVVVIPRNTNHWVEVRQGDSLEYVYINRY